MLFAYAIPITPGTIEQSLAGAGGCCKQHAPDGSWYSNGMGFNQCRSANRRQDNNDDLFQPIGQFWWDVNCH